MKRHRMERVAEAVREVAASTILFELKDPRVKMTTVTRTEVSGDLQHAKIYVSVMGSERDQKLALHGLQHAAGFVQSRLAERLQTRFTPVVTFVLDQGVKNSVEISRLIRETLAEDGTRPDEDEPLPADRGSAEGPANGDDSSRPGISQGGEKNHGSHD